MKHVFLDTDVLIDYITDRKPYADASEKILASIENKQIRGYASSLTFSNLYYLMRKRMSHDKVISMLKDLATLIRILKVDEVAVMKSLNSDFSDFEDAL